MSRTESKYASLKRKAMEESEKPALPPCTEEPTVHYTTRGFCLKYADGRVERIGKNPTFYQRHLLRKHRKAIALFCEAEKEDDNLALLEKKDRKPVREEFKKDRESIKQLYRKAKDAFVQSAKKYEMVRRVYTQYRGNYNSERRRRLDECGKPYEKARIKLYRNLVKTVDAHSKQLIIEMVRVESIYDKSKPEHYDSSDDADPDDKEINDTFYDDSLFNIAIKLESDKNLGKRGCDFD